VIAALLMIVGVALLGYVGAQYWSTYHTQRVLEAQWEDQTNTGAPAVQTLTRISIPKISLDAIVVEGASSRQLAQGPGHLTETPFPGDAGNAVITGHRDTFFRRIFELHPGDEIDVQRNGREFHYEVTGRKIVNPDDVSVLNPTSDAQLTLITCYPIHYVGPAPQRLVIFSKLAP
jgi:sortase A